MTLAAALLFASNAQAQLGVNIGYAPMTIAVDNNGNVSNTDYPGFFGGVNYNVNLTGDLNLSLGGQVRFITKTETSSFYGLASTKNTTTLINLEVPVLLNYGLNLSRELKVSVFAGAVFGYGLSGQTKFEGNVLGAGGNSTVDWCLWCSIHLQPVPPVRWLRPRSDRHRQRQHRHQDQRHFRWHWHGSLTVEHSTHLIPRQCLGIFFIPPFFSTCSVLVR